MNKNSLIKCLNLAIAVALFILCGSCYLLPIARADAYADYEAWHPTVHNDPPFFLCSPPMRYGYSTLEGEDMALYEQFAAALSQHKSDFEISHVEIEHFNKVLPIVLNDHPEIFWIDSNNISYRYSYYEKTGLATEISHLTYRYNPLEREAMQAEIDAVTSVIRANIPENA